MFYLFSLILATLSFSACAPQMAPSGAEEQGSVLADISGIADASELITFNPQYSLECDGLSALKGVSSSGSYAPTNIKFTGIGIKAGRECVLKITGSVPTNKQNKIKWTSLHANPGVLFVSTSGTIKQESNGLSLALNLYKTYSLIEGAKSQLVVQVRYPRTNIITTSSMVRTFLRCNGTAHGNFDDTNAERTVFAYNFLTMDKADSCEFTVYVDKAKFTLKQGSLSLPIVKAGGKFQTPVLDLIDGTANPGQTDVNIAVKLSECKEGQVLDTSDTKPECRYQN